MTDYSELVVALRCKRDDCEGCDLAFLDNDEGWMCRYAAKDDDAADAIEELQAEQKKTVTQIFGEEQMAWEGRCKDLMYEIADLQEQLPKRGEWNITTERFSPELICSECGVHIPCVAGWCMDAHMNYCPNCGAKMMEGHE